MMGPNSSFNPHGIAQHGAREKKDRRLYVKSVEMMLAMIIIFATHGSAGKDGGWDSARERRSVDFS